jgi:hypothetical protein
MPREIPYFISGNVVEILPQEIIIIKVSNGNLYHITPSTPGIEYYRLLVGDIVECEITSVLTRVLSARFIKRKTDAAEEDGNPLVS